MIEHLSRLTPRLVAIASFASCVSIANAQYHQTNLVSDGSVQAAHTDPSLVNA